MGKYPRLLSEFFQDYLLGPLVVLVVLTVGMFIVHKIKMGLVFFFEKRTKQAVVNWLGRIYDFLCFGSVLIVALFISGLIRNVGELIFAGVSCGVIYAVRSEILNLCLGYLIRSRNKLQKGDILMLEDRPARVHRLDTFGVWIERMRGEEIHLGYQEFLNGLIRVFHDESLQKMTVSFEVPASIGEDQLHEQVKIVVKDNFYILKFEYPELKRVEGYDRPLMELNLWTYSDFYWTVHNDVASQLKSALLKSRESQTPYLKVSN